MISVFGGYGFVLGKFSSQFTNTVHVQARDDYVPKYPKILYGISTVDNYNVRTNPYLDIDTNLTTLISVLENSRKTFGNRFEFNFVSSWFVYGKTDKIPAQEDDYCNPTGFYSITKRAAEQLLISYCTTYEIPYRILRLANVIGKGDKKASIKKNALQFLIQEIANGRDISIYKMRAKRDFIDVRDVSIAIDLVLSRGGLNEIFNIGNGRPVVVQDTIRWAKDKFNLPGMIDEMDVPDFHKQVQIENFYLDISRLMSLGYKNKYLLVDSIESLLSE